MNAEHFLAYYEKIADAPDAVERLRQFIFSLAVRGKLVPQLANERRASNFDAELPIDIETSFEIPQNWRWSRLRKLGKLAGGGTPSKLRDNFWDGNIPWVSPKDMKVDYINKSQMNISNDAIAGSAANLIGIGSVLFVVRGMILAHSFPVAISGVPLTINQDMKALSLKEPEMGEFLLRALKGLKPEMLKRVQRSSHGTCRLDSADYGDFLLPLPPLAEQHRIVAKVDELMGLCDRLEAARADRETVRDRLAAASLARLNVSDAETFKEHATFALNALPALTKRPDQIKAVRQAILNLAVYGKLSRQDPNDEPASELLKRIAKKAQAAKREKVKIEIGNEELGELPASWRSVPLITLGSWAIGSGFPKNEQGLSAGIYFFLKVSDMNLLGNEKYITTSNNFIDDTAARRMKAKIHPPGTIIFPKIGGAIATNKRRILANSSAIDNNCLGITFSSELNVEWAFLLLTTLDFTRYQAGTAVPALQQGVLERIPVPLPPLAEQHRIVAKANELMALCDKLEASLTAAADTRRRLLDALLAEALALDEDRLLAAAE